MLDHASDGFANGVEVVLAVSGIGFSIIVGIRNDLILFVRHLLLIATWSSILFQFYVAHSNSVVTFNVELVNDCYVCDDFWPVLGSIQFRPSLHRLGFSMSIISNIKFSGTWYS